MNRTNIMQAVAELSDALTAKMVEPMLATVNYSEHNAKPYCLDVTMWPNTIDKSDKSIKYFSFYFPDDASEEFALACVKEWSRKVNEFADTLNQPTEGKQ